MFFNNTTTKSSQAQMIAQKHYSHSIHPSSVFMEWLLIANHPRALNRVHVAQNPLPQLMKAALHLLVGLALKLRCLALGLTSDLIRLALCLSSDLVRLALCLTGHVGGGLLYSLGDFFCKVR
jgi:hypothetical protein